MTQAYEAGRKGEPEAPLSATRVYHAQSSVALKVAGENDKVNTMTRSPGSSDSCLVPHLAASQTAKRPDLCRVPDDSVAAEGSERGR